MPTKKIKEELKLSPEIILWKKLKIAECKMEFSCGGDSMNDYNFTFYNSKGKEIDNVKVAELKDFFDNEVFRRVEFYEASDGHYIGEFGEVSITLNDDEEEPDFDYSKYSKSEWSETHTDTIEIKLNENEVNFMSKVASIVGGEDGNAINYKGDTILTDEEEEVSTKLLKRIDEEADEHDFNEAVGDAEDWYRFSTRVDDEDVLLINDNKLSVQVQRSYLEIRDDNY